MTFHPIQVLIVEESAEIAKILSAIVTSDPQFAVMGCLSKGKEILPFLQTHQPDVIVIDIHLSDMDGFETTSQVMHNIPTPIIIVSAGFNQKDIDKSFKAIQVGALEIIQKPTDPQDPAFESLAHALIQSIKSAAIIQLKMRRHFTEKAAQLKKQRECKNLLFSVQIIGIGASLGGPTALRTLLSQLSSHFSVPILVVQHIADGFNQGFVNWLQESSLLKIKLAEDGEIVQPGHVYIAPEHYHLEVESHHKIHLSDTPPEEGLRPSVGRLFRSMAKVYGKQAMGIILTGMGHDGAADLLLMKNSGALTIAQSQESCFIFGMPKEAIALGAAQYVLSLELIIDLLNSLVE